MNNRLLVGVLAFVGASAQRFDAQTGQCTGDYCTITTSKECSQAAIELGLSDTTPRDRSRSDQVAGCSTTKAGNLRFNEDLTSTTIHNSGQGQSVLCQHCTQSTTTTAGPTSCGVGQQYCTHDVECPGSTFGQACTIESFTDCEAGAAFLGLPDTSPNDLDDATVVAGCSVNAGAGLRFNSALYSTATLLSGQSQTNICSYCPPCETDLFCQTEVLCDGVFSCPITSAAQCELAAATLSLSDTSVNLKNDPTVVSGCSTNQAGGLRYNTAVSDTPHLSGQGQTVVCVQCEAD